MTSVIADYVYKIRSGGQYLEYWPNKKIVIKHDAIITNLP